jgi:hypothetical protein
MDTWVLRARSGTTQVSCNVLRARLGCQFLVVSDDKCLLVFECLQHFAGIMSAPLGLSAKHDLRRYLAARPIARSPYLSELPGCLVGGATAELYAAQFCRDERMCIVLSRRDTVPSILRYDSACCARNTLP